MKFIFSANIESPEERSIFQMTAAEIGGRAQFIGKEVITEYDGSVNDEAFHKLLSIYETKPERSLTITT